MERCVHAHLLVLGFGLRMAGVGFSARAGGGAVLVVGGEVTAGVLEVELLAPEHHKGERKIMVHWVWVMRVRTELSTAR